jgi:hypothetical protein
MNNTKRFFVRQAINILLCTTGIAVMVYYGFCKSSCMYLKGSMFSIDLQYIGMLYMGMLIVLNLTKQDFLNLLGLAAGFGGEIFLIGFQIKHGRFCPFCLIFGAIVLVQFILNFRWSKKWHILIFVVIGFLIFIFFFKGSMTFTFDLSSSTLPDLSCTQNA